jgi:LuxR family transcriptional regulator, maltose regulon positive regulatory protein
VGADAIDILGTSEPPPIDGVLTVLLNEVGTVASDIVLVLDDYHVIDSREVQDGMAFLLDHVPPQFHLVIASRSDPALPLARLRARGELVEVRAADLRFTPDEAAAYLTGAMGLALTAHEVAALAERTEGWIAALQLAALPMEGRDDVTSFIADFAGDDRYVVDYLVEEVVQRQPEHVGAFLLQTSVLSRLSGPLCDAVTGVDSGKAMLERLDRANLFLVALDDRRQWYRYHQLRRDRREATLRGWLEKLPEELFHIRPMLSMGYVGAMMATGAIEEVEDRLRDVERALDPRATRSWWTMNSSAGCRGGSRSFAQGSHSYSATWRPR